MAWPIHAVFNLLMLTSFDPQTALLNVRSLIFNGGFALLFLGNQTHVLIRVALNLLWLECVKPLIFECAKTMTSKELIEMHIEACMEAMFIITIMIWRLDSQRKTAI
jgi:hypothetical protein